MFPSILLYVTAVFIGIIAFSLVSTWVLMFAQVMGEDYPLLGLTIAGIYFLLVTGGFVWAVYQFLVSVVI